MVRLVLWTSWTLWTVGIDLFVHYPLDASYLRTRSLIWQSVLPPEHLWTSVPSVLPVPLETLQ